MIDTTDQRAVESALSEPFDRGEVKFKPAVVSGSRAMALAYIDARVVQDRLDDVLGPLNWQDDYECLGDGSVICRLRLRIAGEWVQKVDVGGPSEQSDGGDRLKAAFSDALKRAAVKFGIGRYLYRLSSQWVDYDPQKRQFVRPPALPDWAAPKQAPQSAQEAQRADPTAAAGAKNGTQAAPNAAVADGVPRITPRQAEELHALLTATRSDRAKLLDHYHITSGKLSDLPVEHWNDAAGRLRTRQKAQAEQADAIALRTEELKLDWEADLLPHLRREWKTDSVRFLNPLQFAALLSWMERRSKELAAKD